LLALSWDRLLPTPLSAVNRRFQTPHTAVGVTAAVIFLSLFLKLDILVEAASTVLILANVLSCLSVIVLRESGLQNYRPAFKAPIYPWLQIGGILGLGFVLFQMGIEAYFISAGLILAGFLTFWLYGRKRVTQESALLHLVGRLIARELVTGSLEGELRQIVHERDEISLDRFDRLVEQAPVLDVRGHISADEFFDAAGKELAPRLALDAQTVADMLRRREQEGSTLLGPSLAVPHIVVPGEGRFELLLARAKTGIGFSDEAPEVRAAFVLAGSRDERNFHLRALAAIAQIVQERDFKRRWMSATSPQGLRDIALLSQRGRDGAMQ
jgi:mannitol/fructose-specific phosphotransferase system IIA component (Ntr-type)